MQGLRTLTRSPKYPKMMTSNAIPILLNEGYLKFGVASYISWLPSKAPHMVIFGATGSGKTYFTKLLLGKIVSHVPNSQLFVCDYKGDDDFAFLNGCERFSRFDECNVSTFYERLRARQSGEDASRNMLVLFFDEYASYICNLEKKAAESEKRKLASILMQGRSFRVHCIIGLQRPDSQFLESRENFSVAIGLGNLSKESRQMLFSEFKDEMQPDRKQGTGYMLTNGTDFQAVQVPTIKSMSKLHDTIRQGVIR